MPRIFVDFNKLDTVENDIFDVWRKAGEEKGNFKNTIDKLDWEVKSQERILRRSQQVADKLDKIAQSLDSYSKFILHSYEEYDKLEHYEQKLDFGLDGIQDKPTEQRRNNIFDEQNGYGGDQGDMAHNRNGKAFLWWVKGEDEDIYDFVRSQEGYEKYTKRQIHELLEQINNEGCGYVALVNALFWEFNGTEEEFEKLYGFPMRDKDGNYNYNLMLVDIYCKTDDKYFLNIDGGKETLLTEVFADCVLEPEKFEKIFGVKLDMSGSNISDENINAVLSRYDGKDVAIYKTSRGMLAEYSQYNRLLGYLNEKGIKADVDFFCENFLSNENIKKYLDDGNVVEIGLNEGTVFFDAKGNERLKLGGGHAVLITGVTEDGRYIISSYGEKYYINPNQMVVDVYNGESTSAIMGYSVININYK